MNTNEVLKLALEALEGIHPGNMTPMAEEYWNTSITVLREALAHPQPEPVATLWQQAPIRTTWGDEMMVASVAIDNDHTLSLYCERDQTPKVDAMFAQRKPLTDEEMYLAIRPLFRTDAFANAALKLSKDEYQAIEAAHGIKENT